MSDGSVSATAIRICLGYSTPSLALADAMLIWSPGERENRRGMARAPNKLFLFICVLSLPLSFFFSFLAMN